MATVSTTRRAGQAFDAFEAEQYAQARASGQTIGVSATSAGVGLAAAKTLEKDPEVRSRIAELREGSKTITTVSPAWILEQLKINALESREGREYTTINKAGEQVEVTSAPNYKASNEALQMMYEIIKTDDSILNGLGGGLPAGSKAMMQEIQKRLSAPAPQPIIITQHEAVEAEL